MNTSQVSLSGFTPILAATLPPQLKNALGLGLLIIMSIVFIWGVLDVIGGIQQVRRGDPDGKMGIIVGVVKAGAVAIMTAIYAAFSLSGATISVTD